MSFIDEIKQELQVEQPAEPLRVPKQGDKRFQSFLDEEIASLQNEIRRAVKTGKYKTAGEKHIFEGRRLWHEGDYRQGTESLATFYPFLARDTILQKEILEQRKKMVIGYYYAVSFRLTPDGEQYVLLFKQALAKEGITVDGLFVRDGRTKGAPLPYVAHGHVRYDFELEHHLNDYPQLFYTWKMEV